MSYSLAIQQSFWHTVFEGSYVGSLSRHLPNGQDINVIPMYAHFNAKNADPSRPAVPLPDNLLRPYRGFGSLTMYSYDATSNYNALQASINRRFKSGIQFGIAYTFSKALGVANGDGSVVSSYFPARSRNYGALPFDRSQYFVANYVYDLPKLGQRLGSKAVGWALDNWQISGVTAFVSGSPFTPGFSTTDGADITGFSEGARINVAGAPELAKSDKTFFQNFNTSVFRRPVKGDEAGAFFPATPPRPRTRRIGSLRGGRLRILCGACGRA
jgi:hypothetical protein